MKPLKTLWLIVPACLLTACADLIGSGDPDRLRVSPPDAAVAQPCDGPAPIPATATMQRAQEALWRRDRISLAQCRDRHGAAIQWIDGVTGAFKQE